jgi:hypothetical protein
MGIARVTATKTRVKNPGVTKVPVVISEEDNRYPSKAFIIKRVKHFWSFHPFILSSYY